MASVDAIELETKVKDRYRHGPSSRTAYQFEAGHALAERPWVRGRPSRQDSGRGIESFAGVGYFVDLADLRPGERVMDLGSGSGMDTFVAGALARLRRSQDGGPRTAQASRTSAPVISAGVRPRPWR